MGQEQVNEGRGSQKLLHQVIDDDTKDKEFDAQTSRPTEAKKEEAFSVNINQNRKDWRRSDEEPIVDKQIWAGGADKDAPKECSELDE